MNDQIRRRGIVLDAIICLTTENPALPPAPLVAVSRAAKRASNQQPCPIPFKATNGRHADLWLAE